MAPPGVSFSLQIEDQGLVEFDLSAANYKLALTRTLPMTEQQRHLPSASTEIEPYAAIAFDLQQPLREFRVDAYNPTILQVSSGGSSDHI